MFFKKNKKGLELKSPSDFLLFVPTVLQKKKKIFASDHLTFSDFVPKQRYSLLRLDIAVPAGGAGGAKNNDQI